MMDGNKCGCGQLRTYGVEAQGGVGARGGQGDQGAVDAGAAWHSAMHSIAGGGDRQAHKHNIHTERRIDRQTTRQID